MDPIRPPVVASTGGPVKVNVLVGLNGAVLRAVAVEGPVALRAGARAAVRQWVYSPTLLNGKPVYVLSSISLTF